MKRPAFQFYPSDWRKDAALQSCSLAAQGMWVNMMCIAHECDPYGHLVVNGRPMTPAQVGRLVGLSAKETEKLLNELLDAGVPSVTAEGVIFSRRMVRDEDLRERRADGGKAGAEHGEKGGEHGAKGGRPRKKQGGINNPPSEEARGVIYPPKEPPPSSSSSSSSSSLNTPLPPDGGTPPLQPEPKAPRAAKKCPASFVVTDEMRQWAADNVPAVQVDAETSKLRDHTFAAARSDWLGTWRNWLRKAEEHMAQRRGTAAAAESFRERDARLAAEQVKRLTGGLVHDRTALGEAPKRELLPFERGYVAPATTAETIEGDSNVRRLR